MHTPLQQREIFHLGFLRLFSRRVRPDIYALKGGVNLRFFYQSPRYSEDIDLDIQKIPFHRLKEIVLNILTSPTLLTSLKPFQIESLGPPDRDKAKQTETVQRFKVHLLTAAGEDLFTKIEFSRRGLQAGVRQDPIPDSLLFSYKQPPLIISHYPAETAFTQKWEAVLGRLAVQARDIFDLFILLPQIDPQALKVMRQKFSKESQIAVKKKLASVDYQTYKNIICPYLNEEDREYYDRPEVWETILHKVGEILR